MAEVLVTLFISKSHHGSSHCTDNKSVTTFKKQQPHVFWLKGNRKG